MRYKLLLLILSIFLGFKGYAEDVRVIKEGPIHEAFITQEKGSLILESRPAPPSSKIKEQLPKNIDPYSDWISGYWDWSEEHEGYLWISGVWRRPPPGLTWIPGYWKQYQDGWVRFKGFWSLKGEEEIQLIAKPPPDPIDEIATFPPDRDYFWMPGYWHFDHSSGRYTWIDGAWEPFDPEWVYTPGHYIWRKNGYIFIPAYWDWPLEERGTLYASLFIPIDEEYLKIIQKPKNPLQPLFIIEALYPFWPNYASLFQFHYFYHLDLWKKWGGAPPWWNWDDWWTLNWQNRWDLWWWWTHPGYPAPFFIDEKLAEQIPPPKKFILKIMSKIPTPFFVTKNGVVGTMTILKAIRKVTGSNIPVLPNDRQEKFQIEKFAQPKKNWHPVQPKGEEELQTTSSQRKRENSLQQTPTLTVVPPKKPSEPKPPSPNTKPRKPPTYKPSPPAYKFTPKEPENDTEESSKNGSSTENVKKKRYAAVSVQSVPPKNLPNIPHPRVPPGYIPPKTSDFPVVNRYRGDAFHGTTPPHHYIEDPMGIHHHDYISSYPHPQINPPSPEVHMRARERERIYPSQEEETEEPLYPY